MIRAGLQRYSSWCNLPEGGLSMKQGRPHKLPCFIPSPLSVNQALLREMEKRETCLNKPLMQRRRSVEHGAISLARLLLCA